MFLKRHYALIQPEIDDRDIRDIFCFKNNVKFLINYHISNGLEK